jgi:hypothetical protein
MTDGVLVRGGDALVGRAEAASDELFPGWEEGLSPGDQIELLVHARFTVPADGRAPSAIFQAVKDARAALARTAGVDAEDVTAKVRLPAGVRTLAF